MKTLIFNGSPRKNGETMKLIQEFLSEAPEEVTVIHAYDASIKACIDCRYCYRHSGCAIKDDMQAVYKAIEEADCILIASPVYFGELSGQMLAQFSRLQTYFSARYIRKEEPVPKKKTGGILLTAGSFGPREKAESTARFLLEQMNAQCAGTVYIDWTDKKGVEQSEDILEETRMLAKKCYNT